MRQSIDQKGHPLFRAYCWMWQNHADYYDQCNELDCTKLAEDAADQFDLYLGDGSTIPEDLFWGAHLVAEKATAQRKAS